MRVECEPSRSVSKKASGKSSRERIQRSLELFARSKCSQRNSFAVSCRAIHSTTPLESIGTPASSATKRKPQTRPEKSEP
jgi:hypothetical protein